MAGAEGIEPSACGFGVDVEKNLYRNAFRLFQPFDGFRRFAPLYFDAVLMLFPMPSPRKPAGTQTLWIKASWGTQNLRQRIQRIETSIGNWFDLFPVPILRRDKVSQQNFVELTTTPPSLFQLIVKNIDAYYNCRILQKSPMSLQNVMWGIFVGLTYFTDLGPQLRSVV